MNDEETETRDVRFKNILKQQLGENGMNIITNLSLLFVLCLFIVISALIVTITNFKNCSNNPPINSNAVIPK